MSQNYKIVERLSELSATVRSLDSEGSFSSGIASNKIDQAASLIQELGEALETFVKEFEIRRDSYIRRYRDNPDLGASNFDKMPDSWEMENVVFTMGEMRRARAILSKLKEA